MKRTCFCKMLCVMVCMLLVAAQVCAQGTSVFPFNAQTYVDALEAIVPVYTQSECTISRDEMVYEVSSDAIGRILVSIDTQNAVTEVATGFIVPMYNTEEIGIACKALGQALPLMAIAARYVITAGSAELLSTESSTITTAALQLESIFAEVTMEQAKNSEKLSKTMEIGGYQMTLSISFLQDGQDVSMICNAVYQAQ